jgi:16S rRNA (guanine966-N2)-methyltransferase
VADLVEIAPACLRCIADNARTLEAGDRAVVHRTDALRYVAALEPHAYDIAFADPPYGHHLATRVAEAWLAVPFADILGVEHRKDESLPGPGSRRVYGDTVITIYRTD